MISHEKKFIFIHMPRTGGTHLSEFLRPYCDEESLRFSPYQSSGNLHATMIDYVNHYGERILDYTLFTIIRNPWERALSHAIFHNNKTFDKEYFKKVIYEPYRHHLWPHSHFHFLIREPFVGPLQPVGYLPITPPIMQKVRELFYWPKFIRFENYAIDTAKIFDKLGIKYEPERLKKRTNITKHKHYSHYYEDDEIFKMETVCGLDLQLFGYTFKDKRKK